MTITPRAIYDATLRMQGSRAKHFAAALGLDLDAALPYWPAAQEILAKRAARAERNRPVSAVPAWRRLASARALAGIRARLDAGIAAGQARAERRAAVRQSLLAAARIARAAGYRVRRSSDRAGRVSSYYVELGHDRPALRISDHEIPATARRDFVAACHGAHSGYEGYRGPELLIDRPRSATWLRRAITLAAAGRCVPGA